MSKNHTSWQPGVCPNPGGRPRIAREVRASAQQKAKRAFEVVLDVMENGDKDAARLAAAVRVLQVAGVPLSADKDPAGPGPEAPPSNGKPQSEGDLLEAAAEGTA